MLGGSALVGFLWIKIRGYIYMGWIENAKDMEAWYEKLGDAAEIYSKVTFAESYSGSITTILTWSALYFAIKSYRVFQEVRESALRSAAMAHEAQLKMLRYQLNPHFLFNTLNAISTLVLEQNTELANRMVTKLSSFLRYSLDNDPMQKITLEQELQALQLYLDIEKVRFEERLSLEVDIEETAKDALIPSLLLQPLIENAIKYGIARAEGGGHLKISARVFAGDLLMEVSDDGPGCELVNNNIPDAKGVGLRNTRERLAAIYGSEHSIKAEPDRPTRPDHLYPHSIYTKTQTGLKPFLTRETLSPLSVNVTCHRAAVSGVASLLMQTSLGMYTCLNATLQIPGFTSSHSMRLTRYLDPVFVAALVCLVKYTQTVDQLDTRRTCGYSVQPRSAGVKDGSSVSANFSQHAQQV